MLCTNNVYTLYLFLACVLSSARNEGRGQEAVETLEKEGLKPKFHVLDITDHKSIVSLRDYLKVTYAGLDILVNNAAIMYSVSYDKRNMNLIHSSFVL